MNGAAVIAEILRREGTEFLSCYPRNPLIEACAALDIRPILCRQERVGVGIGGRLHPHQARQAQRRVRRASRSRHRECLPGRRPGVCRERADAGDSRRRCRWRANTCARCSAPPTSTGRSPNGRRWPIRVQELPDLMRRAYHAMRSGKGGPVLIEVPAEVWEAEYQGELDYAPVPVQRAAPDPDAVKKAVRMLLAAKNPLLWAGQGVLYAQAERSPRGAGRAHSGACRHHQPGQERDSRKPSARARRLDPLAAEDGHRVHGQGRSRAGRRLEPHPHAVRAQRAGRQDDHPCHQRRRRHQQGVSGRPCGDRRRRAGARRDHCRSRSAKGRRAGRTRSPPSRRRSPRPRKRGSRNGTSISIPRKCRSISIASFAI